MCNWYRLAGSSKNPTIFALPKSEAVKTLYSIQSTSFNLFSHEIALRVIRRNKLIEEKTYKAIEAHPTSTLKALQVPLRFEGTPRQPKNIGLKEKIETHPLMTYEIDAVTAASTAVIHVQAKLSV
jgi:predicted nuclease with RNAse H fold